MHSFTVDEYVKAGCKAMYGQAILAVHSLTGGKVCDTECAEGSNQHGAFN